jgi:hypothetical protein
MTEVVAMREDDLSRYTVLIKRDDKEVAMSLSDQIFEDHPFYLHRWVKNFLKLLEGFGG